jgi:hypothetical protein
LHKCLYYVSHADTSSYGGGFGASRAEVWLPSQTEMVKGVINTVVKSTIEKSIFSVY